MCLSPLVLSVKKERRKTLPCSVRQFKRESPAPDEHTHTHAQKLLGGCDLYRRGIVCCKPTCSRCRRGDNPEDCPVCLVSFDDTVQRPRSLPCGHTVCTLCINKLQEQGHVTCPECRVSHTVPEGGQFPVSYIAEAFIRMRVTETAASASPPPSAGKGKRAATAADKREAAGLSRKMRSFLQEQEATVVAAITTCQELQSQLDHYQTTLTDWRERQQQLEDRLQGLVEQSKSARELVLQEESCVAAKKEEVKKGEQQLHATLETLRTLTTEQEVGGTVTEVVRYTGEAEQVVEECQESFPDAHTVTTVWKAREASSAALEAFQAVQAALETHPTVAAEELRPQSDPDSTIKDRLQVILSPSLKPEDLRSMTQPTKSLLEADLVFAVHQVEGQRRSARISLEAGKLYLHTLKEHLPPPGAATLQVSQLVPPSPPCMVFLELRWPGSAPRRVHVHLPRNTTLGRQFVLLCTGQRGASYANTTLLRVWDKGKAGERVGGGDYERNDETGGAPLLPGLDDGECWKSGRAGAVAGRWVSNPARGAQFVIITRDWQEGRVFAPVFLRVFGEVVEGMEAVVAAAQHTNIEEVMVVDCGVVL